MFTARIQPVSQSECRKAVASIITEYSTRGYVQIREKFEAFSLEALTKELLRVLWLARVV